MKLAIHHRPGSFSDRWIAYCEKKGIDYKIVDAFDSDIIQQVSDCDAFMWHHHHAQFKDVLTAKRILFALEHAGVKVFPDFKTGWHFDDKVAQKYLLEAIGAPLVPSYVFYDKQQALDWASTTSYPKVFKLKGGAGAANVKLVKTQEECNKLIQRAFGRGFSQFDRLEFLRERLRKFKNGTHTFLDLIKGFYLAFKSTEFSKKIDKEKGYIYFQDFIENNEFDIRVVVVGGKHAAAEKRYVRENDFRASASGKFSYKGIDNKVIEVAFDIAQRLEMESVAFDFVFEGNKPMIIEMSYGFGTTGISKAHGYWDNELNWHESNFNAHNWMIEAIV